MHRVRYAGSQRRPAIHRRQQCRRAAQANDRRRNQHRVAPLADAVWLELVPYSRGIACERHDALVLLLRVQTGRNAYRRTHTDNRASRGRGSARPPHTRVPRAQNHLSANSGRNSTPQRPDNPCLPARRVQSSRQIVSHGMPSPSPSRRVRPNRSRWYFASAQVRISLQWRLDPHSGSAASSLPLLIRRPTPFCERAPRCQSQGAMACGEDRRPRFAFRARASSSRKLRSVLYFRYTQACPSTTNSRLMSRPSRHSRGRWESTLDNLLSFKYYIY